jgi:hypothetical protein
MTNDRTYWRMMPNSDLIIAAAERYTTDLELVLLERLEELHAADEHLYAAQAEIEDLKAEIAILESE